MISFDLECANNHRFEGIFKDFKAFDEQLTKSMIECPICGDIKIKRLFTGCSIQPGGSIALHPEKYTGPAHVDTPKENNLADSISANDNMPNMFEMIRMVKDYVEKNYEYVGKNFADKAKAIYYGVEEERKIYGESTPEEIKELTNEGIDILPIPNIDEIEN